MKYSKHYGTKKTSQLEAVPGKDMAENNAGGFSFKITPWQKLDRFLILGSEGGTYYTSEKKLTKSNAKNLQELIQSDGVKVVKRIVEVSEGGLAPSNDPAIFALALCASMGDDITRKAAFDVLPRVARIGTHLFHFVREVNEFRGWGRGLRRAVANWYTEPPIDRVANQLVKYRQRDGWSHRDLLRLSHAKTSEPIRNNMFGWVIDSQKEVTNFPRAIEAYIKFQKETDIKETVKLINEYSDVVTWELIPTDLLGKAEVWVPLVENGLPMTALIRNLGRLTSLAVLKPMSSLTKKVIEQLSDEDRLRKARVHPYQALLALKTYAQGKGIKGSLTWNPIGAIVDALDDAFYKAFKNVEPTGKRWLLGLDVSSSMTWGGINGGPITPRVGSAAMAMVTANTEKDVQVCGFSHKFVPINLTRKMRLDSVIQTIEKIPMGGTDCSLPMLEALKNKWEVDVFAVYTDNETWAGNIHPFQALKQYRQKMGIPAKLIVIGMTATNFSIADPDDSGMMDVVGFDASAPGVMSQFAAQ